jgi:hypothetical protein
MDVDNYLVEDSSIFGQEHAFFYFPDELSFISVLVLLYILVIRFNGN